MQSALERRQQIIEAISDRRQDTMANLASEFGVSKMTIRRDIEYLTCSYPIFTVLGNGGGVRAMDGWYISRRYMRVKMKLFCASSYPDCSRTSRPP